MGYILPIGFDQYQQYQGRIKGSKINEYRKMNVERVKKAYLFNIQALVREKAGRSNQGSIQEKYRKQQGKGADKVYAELTGIGGVFNEIV